MNVREWPSGHCNDSYPLLVALPCLLLEIEVVCGQATQGADLLAAKLSDTAWWGLSRQHIPLTAAKPRGRDGIVDDPDLTIPLSSRINTVIRRVACSSVLSESLSIEKTQSRRSVLPLSGTSGLQRQGNFAPQPVEIGVAHRPTAGASQLVVLHPPHPWGRAAQTRP